MRPVRMPPGATAEINAISMAYLFKYWSAMPAEKKQMPTPATMLTVAIAPGMAPATKASRYLPSGNTLRRTLRRQQRRRKRPQEIGNLSRGVAYQFDSFLRLTLTT